MDIGASRSTVRYFSRYPGLRYRTIDKYREADIVGDILDIPLDDQSVDSVICFHVLEHVKDYEKALAEILRISKPGKTGIIAVPQVKGLDKSRRVESPDFEGYGHVWEFGEDFPEILRKAGFSVKTVRVPLDSGKGRSGPFHLVKKGDKG